MPNNRPTICTADEQNCISLTSRLHFDAGGYDYRPNTADTKPQRLDDGVNARRARIGVLGKFLGDWNYFLYYDFAGASDGFAGTASAGGTAVGFLPGGSLSGIERAYLGYTGIKPFGGQLAIEGAGPQLRPEDHCSQAGHTHQPDQRNRRAWSGNDCSHRAGL